jgi:dTMP kinase
MLIAFEGLDQSGKETQARRLRDRLRASQHKARVVSFPFDRYVASTIAYGEAQGLDRGWLIDIQRFLPQPDLTIFLDIAPEIALERKATGRDRYERDHALQVGVRSSYLRQAEDPTWRRVDGARPADQIADEVAELVPMVSGGVSAPSS